MPRSGSARGRQGHPGSDGLRPHKKRPGRPRGRRAAARRRSEDRLLEGALRAVACHGLAKIGMSDVSAYAGVSRGTAYRYFPDTDAVLRALGQREAERFEHQVWEALEKAPEGEERLRVALDYVDRLAREHPLIQRLPETDPGFVLTSLRERFADIRDAFQRLLGPLLEDTDLVRSGVVGADRLAGWTARMMVSLFLFPEPEPDRTTDDLRTVYRIMAGTAARRSTSSSASPIDRTEERHRDS
ncbi:MAG: TetR/AcrR family transcriptional regulator [Myxococcota bacterium]